MAIPRLQELPYAAVRFAFFVMMAVSGLPADKAIDREINDVVKNPEHGWVKRRL